MTSNLQMRTILQADGEAHARSHLSRLVIVAALCFSAACHADIAPADGGVVPSNVMTIRSRVAEPAANLSSTGDIRQTNELVGVGYRWWSSHGKADVGVGVGTLGRLTLSPEPYAPASASTLSNAGSVMMLGLRYRVSNTSAVYADASRASLSGADERVQYNARLGMEWRAAKRQQLGFEPGTLGVQLDSGYKMSVRLRSGGVKLMLRSQF